MSRLPSQRATRPDKQRRPDGQDGRGDGSCHVGGPRSQIEGVCFEEIWKRQEEVSMGHFFSILGARMMARTGIEQLKFIDVGRWKTVSLLGEI